MNGHDWLCPYQRVENDKKREFEESLGLPCPSVCSKIIKPNYLHWHYVDPPTYRVSGNGANWRHLQETTTYDGKPLLFMDGMVKVVDQYRYPPYGHPSQENYGAPVPPVVVNTNRYKAPVPPIGAGSNYDHSYNRPKMWRPTLFRPIQHATDLYAYQPDPCSFVSSPFRPSTTDCNPSSINSGYLPNTHPSSVRTADPCKDYRSYQAGPPNYGSAGQNNPKPANDYYLPAFGSGRANNQNNYRPNVSNVFNIGGEDGAQMSKIRTSILDGQRAPYNPSGPFTQLCTACPVAKSTSLPSLYPIRADPNKFISCVDSENRIPCTDTERRMGHFNTLRHINKYDYLAPVHHNYPQWKPNMVFPERKYFTH